MRKLSIIKRTCFAAVIVAVVSIFLTAPAYAHDLDSADDPIYCVGSVSKIYVSAALLKLAEEGKLDIDAPVTDYIPEFKMADARYKDITVRMLMDHTSGIMGTTMPGDFLYADNNTLHHDTLLKELSTQRLKADPGAYAAYCNDGFDLLELVVEHISGMSYTDYVEQMIAKPYGMKNTGTGYSMLKNAHLVPAVSPRGALYENGMTMCIGAGGIYATAADAAEFGSLFFKGNKKLLSDETKDEMKKRWTQEDDPYLDENGLGWDVVDLPKYEKSGISVQYKGGDAMMNHAMLLIAPEEEISVAILTNGGASYFNGMLSQALLDVILEERGVNVQEEEAKDYRIKETIPESFDAYEGFYGIQNDLDGGAIISRVTFPDHRYMHVENHSATRTTVQDFLLCEDETFVELAFEVENGDLWTAKPAAEPTVVSFVKKDGTVYLAEHNAMVAPGLGTVERNMYAGQRMEENPVSKEVLAKWSKRCAKDYLLCNDLYSSSAYSAGITRIYLSDAIPGYLYAVTQMGSRLLKIVDEDHAIAPFEIPSSINRDLIDLSVEQGKDGECLALSAGIRYISSDAVPVLDAPGRFEPKEREPLWFKIGDEIANRPLCLKERSQMSEVIVYNKYGEPVYDSHLVEPGADIPMPKDGYIVFTGQTGDVIILE